MNLPDRIQDFDRRIMARVANPAGATKSAALVVTFLGSALFTLPLEILGWLFGGAGLAPVAGLCLLADVPGHLLLIVPIRYLTRRQRPTPFTGAPLGFDQWNIYSFPSAHSLRTWTLATILSINFPAFCWAFCLAAAVITGTRIFLRRHYPSDIAVGATLGILLGLVVVRVFPAGIAPPF